MFREAFIPATGIRVRCTHTISLRRRQTWSKRTGRFARGQRFVGVSSVLFLVYCLVYAAYRAMEAGLAKYLGLLATAIEREG